MNYPSNTSKIRRRMGRRGIAPLILNISTRYGEWLASRPTRLISAKELLICNE